MSMVVLEKATNLFGSPIPGGLWWVRAENPAQAFGVRSTLKRVEIPFVTYTDTLLGIGPEDLRYTRNSLISAGYTVQWG